MCRLFGYLGNDPSLLPLAFGQVRDNLVEDCTVPGEGWGVGFFQDDRALVRKRPKILVERVSFADITSDLRARSVVGQVRRGSRGDVSPENTPPFRFRNWLFANQGDIAFTDPAHAALRDNLPDFLRHNIWGQTDAEPALHLFFEHLRTLSHIESPTIPTPRLVEATAAFLSNLQQVLRASGQEQAPELNLLYLNGRSLIAIQHNSKIPLAFRSIHTLQSQDPPLFAGHRTRVVDHAHYRGVFVAFEPKNPNDTWTYTPESSIVIVDEHLQVHVHPIQI